MLMRSVGAAATGAEGRTVGLTLGAGSFILHADPGCAALIIYGVVLAAGHVTGNAGIYFTAFFLIHCRALHP